MELLRVLCLGLICSTSVFASTDLEVTRKQEHWFTYSAAQRPIVENLVFFIENLNYSLEGSEDGNEIKASTLFFARYETDQIFEYNDPFVSMEDSINEYLEDQCNFGASENKAILSLVNEWFRFALGKETGAVFLRWAFENQHILGTQGLSSELTGLRNALLDYYQLLSLRDPRDPIPTVDPRGLEGDPVWIKCDHMSQIYGCSFIPPENRPVCNQGGLPTYVNGVCQCIDCAGVSCPEDSSRRCYGYAFPTPLPDNPNNQAPSCSCKSRSRIDLPI